MLKPIQIKALTNLKLLASVNLLNVVHRNYSYASET